MGENWLGSFGVVTGFATVVIILTFKGKLGWYGRSMRRFFQNKRGNKRKIFIILQISFATVMLSLFIYGVNHIENNDRFDLERQEIVALLPNEGLDTTEKITSKAIDEIQDAPEMILIAIVVLGYMMLFDFDKYALIVWSINDVTDGMYLNLATILLVEEIEVIGIFVFYALYGDRLTPKKQQT